MKYEILPDHRLRIYCTPEEQKELRKLIDSDEFELPDKSEVLEPLISNSELDWIPEGSTGDLTSAPMLGILGEEGVKDHTVFLENFGLVECGQDGHNIFVRPIIARWAFMDYQVRSFLDDLAEKGECIWEGGYAEGFRPEIEVVTNILAKAQSVEVPE